MSETWTEWYVWHEVRAPANMNPKKKWGLSTGKFNLGSQQAAEKHAGDLNKSGGKNIRKARVVKATYQYVEEEKDLFENQKRLEEILKKISHDFGKDIGLTHEYIAMILDVSGVKAPHVG